MNLLEFIKLDYINIICTLISAIGAWKSCTYYKRIKKVNEYSSLQDAIITLQEIQYLLTDVWKNIGEEQKNRRGINLSQKIKENGTKIDKDLTRIMNSLSADCSKLMKETLHKTPYPPIEYIGSLISGEYIDDKFGTQKYQSCKTKIEDIQLYLKGESEKLETSIST